MSNFKLPNKFKQNNNLTATLLQSLVAKSNAPAKVKGFAKHMSSQSYIDMISDIKKQQAAFKLTCNLNPSHSAALIAPLFYQQLVKDYTGIYGQGADVLVPILAIGMQNEVSDIFKK